MEKEKAGSSSSAAGTSGKKSALKKTPSFKSLKKLKGPVLSTVFAPVTSMTSKKAPAWTPQTDSLPFLVEYIMDYLEKAGHAKTLEGIFRISGSMKEIQQLKKSLDRGEKVDMSEINPHTVTGTLKLFFRELQEPIFTFDLYDIWLLVCDMDKRPEQQNQCIRKLLQLLPRGSSEIIHLDYHYHQRNCHFHYSKKHETEQDCQDI